MYKKPEHMNQEYWETRVLPKCGVHYYVSMDDKVGYIFGSEYYEEVK